MIIVFHFILQTFLALTHPIMLVFAHKLCCVFRNKYVQPFMYERLCGARQSAWEIVLRTYLNDSNVLTALMPMLLESKAFQVYESASYLPLYISNLRLTTKTFINLMI